MCDCLEKIRKRLEEHHKTPVELELKLLIDMTDLQTEEFASRLALPPMYYTYMIGKKRKKSYVHFNYCPFCGTRYEAKEEPKPAPGPEHLVIG